MQQSIIIGVMGGADPGPEVEAAALDMGRLIANQGWILLNGGRNVGVMAASARGAAEKGGLTVGILPGETSTGACEHIAISILTGMGMARNCINVLSSTVVVAFPGGAGTISEIALALKYDRPVILVGFDPGGLLLSYKAAGRLFTVKSPDQAIERIREILHVT